MKKFFIGLGCVLALFVTSVIIAQLHESWVWGSGEVEHVERMFGDSSLPKLQQYHEQHCSLRSNFCVALELLITQKEKREACEKARTTQEVSEKCTKEMLVMLRTAK